tara:strand:+ start:3761 stop:3949 length:189 start_codon:yes stop_codon:yes gene_type:complete
MLTFAENILREMKKLENDSEQIVLGGTVASMERYRFLMGRLEGIRLVEDIVKNQLQMVSEDE